MLSGTKLYVAFIDFKKAFDSVNRNILWNIFRTNGIQGKRMDILKAVYASVKACARYNSHEFTDLF